MLLVIVAEAKDKIYGNGKRAPQIKIKKLVDVSMMTVMLLFST